MKRVTQFIFLSLLCCGFRVMPGHQKWYIDKSDPTIWLKFCETKDAFDDYTLDSDDPLYGTTPSWSTIVRSIRDDFNNIEGSYLRIADYPSDPNNPGATEAGDSGFTIEKAAVRTIDVCFSTQFLSGGHSSPTVKDGHVVGCTIKLNKNGMGKLRSTIRTITHEMGHCFGLDHPQESLESVMSYSGEKYRLALDDKMGIIYNFPQEDRYAQEAFTFGTACAPKQQ